MKLISSIFVIILASFAFAAEPETCKAGSTEAACNESHTENDAHGHDSKNAKKGEQHGPTGHSDAHDSHGGHGKNKDWSHKRAEQVAAVLVQPKADTTKSNRPAAVKLTSPAFLSKVAGTSVKLTWTKSDLAKTYHLQVSKDAGFNNRSMYVVNENKLADTSFEVTNLEPNTKYFWRVAAFNEDLMTQFTKSAFTFSEFTTK